MLKCLIYQRAVTVIFLKIPNILGLKLQLKGDRQFLITVRNFYTAH